MSKVTRIRKPTLNSVSTLLEPRNLPPVARKPLHNAYLEHVLFGPPVIEAMRGRHANFLTNEAIQDPPNEHWLYTHGRRIRMYWRHELNCGKDKMEMVMGRKPWPNEYAKYAETECEASLIEEYMVAGVPMPKRWFTTKRRIHIPQFTQVTVTDMRYVNKDRTIRLPELQAMHDAGETIPEPEFTLIMLDYKRYEPSKTMELVASAHQSGEAEEAPAGERPAAG